jgi:hypothetical protein
MPFLTRKRTILIKAESVYGTDSVPTGADALAVTSLDVPGMEGDSVDRNLIRRFLGASPSLLVNVRVPCSFEVELAGSGTAGTAPRWSPAMLACGNALTTIAATSNKYDPIDENVSSATIYYFADGIKHAVTGWRGTWEIVGELNQIPKLAFTGTGIYNTPVDSSPGSVTYGGQADPLAFTQGNTSGFSLFGFAGCLQSLSFASNNEVVYDELIGCVKEVSIRNRSCAGQLMIEAPPIATKDFFSITRGNTTGSMGLTHGVAAGNRVILTSPQTDLITCRYADSNGKIMLDIGYSATPTTAGNNEYSILLN